MSCHAYVIMNIKDFQPPVIRVGRRVHAVGFFLSYNSVLALNREVIMMHKKELHTQSNGIAAMEGNLSVFSFPE